jgi:RNA polymerase sigma-70 factor, ECF subfamily
VSNHEPPLTPHGAAAETEAGRWTRWLEAARAGDREAFNRLVEAAEEYVYVYAYRIVLDEQLAEDVMQDTFCRVWALRASYNSKLSNAKTWIRRIAFSIAVDHYRKRAHRPASFSDLCREDGNESPEVPDRRAQDPAELADAPQVAALVRQALARLDFDDRTLLCLCHIEELSYEEMAEVLQCPITTLGPRLTRARKKFRHVLAPDAVP